jgi:hypothetical protein
VPRLAVTAVAAASLAVATAGCGRSSQGPRLVVGAVEDSAKFGDAAAAMDLAARAGLQAIVLSAVWTPPRDAVAGGDLQALQRAVAAAEERHIRPIVAVYQFSGTTPLSETEQRQFAGYAASIPRLLPGVKDVIVGNEPNLNLFWMPQYTPSGGDAAAPAYLRLLARAYDAIKAASPDVNVIGGSLAPRGSDNPAASRPTHSPTRFIEDLRAAYRASGRKRPVMDMFSIHPYPESSSIPPTFRHPRTTPIGIADYGKLVRLLDDAFGGALPIAYGEYGVQTSIPPGAAGLYSGSEPAPTRPVSYAAQASAYGQAIRLAACQPRVRMLLFFHVSDESELDRLQTGLYEPDGAPKPSRDAVRRATQALADGDVPCG